MHIVTTYLSPDEPAQAIWEGYEIAPIPDAPNGATGWRWLQKIFVVRDDTVAKYITDFGDADAYEMITPLAMWSGGADTVGQLQEYADKNREDTYWQTRAKEMLAESTLISDLIEQEEKIHKIIRNQTVSGPYVTNQRNGYAREVNQRNFKERRQKATGKVKFLT